MHHINVVLTLTIIISNANINAQNNFSCPKVTPVNNFEFGRYFTGKWYEISRYDSFDLEDKSICTYGTYEYDDVKKESNISLYDVIGGKLKSVGGTVKFAPDAGKTGKILSDFYRGAKELLPLYILLTDYDTYGIMYNCFYDKKTKNTIEVGWVLSRAHKLPPASQSVVDKFINTSHVLNNNTFVWDDYNKDVCLENNM